MKPMLAKEAVPSKLRFPIAAQEKLDGIRVSIVNGQALTRTLKEVPNREVFAALSHPAFEGLDGEIIVGSPTAADAYRRTASFVMAPRKRGESWCFHVFDKWDESGPFVDRWVAANHALSNSAAPPQHTKLLNYLVCDDAAALEAFEAATVAAGHEGVILRDPLGTYKFGRSSVTKGELLKMKRFVDFEAEVIGVYEEQRNDNEAVRNALGRTERSTKAAGKVGKDRLGGLVLRAVNGPAEGVEFRCGTGFDHEQREVLWRHHEAIVAGGHLAKIKSFPIGAKDKPRFPVFLGWRDEADL